MDYRYLEAFLSTAKRLSFTKAAEDLGVTQAAISRQIRLLEEALDLQLFIRSPQKVVLTPEGERLYREGAKFAHWISEDLKEGTPTLQIAALQGIVESWLLPVLERHFRAASVNFLVRTGTQDEIDRAIESGEVDVGINSHNLQSDTLTSFRLFQEKIVVVSRRPVDLARLHEQPWVTFDPASYLIPFCGRKSKRIIQVESNNAALALVARGVGITMLPVHLLHNPAMLQISPVERFKTEFIWATTFSYAKPPAHLQAFLHELRSAAAGG